MFRSKEPLNLCTSIRVVSLEKWSIDNETLFDRHNIDIDNLLIFEISLRALWHEFGTGPAKRRERWGNKILLWRLFHHTDFTSSSLLIGVANYLLTVGLFTCYILLVNVRCLRVEFNYKNKSEPHFFTI